MARRSISWMSVDGLNMASSDMARTLPPTISSPGRAQPERERVSPAPTGQHGGTPLRRAAMADAVQAAVVSRSANETPESLSRRLELQPEDPSREFLQDWFYGRDTALADLEALHVGFRHGVRPVGGVHTVNASRGRMLESVDGRPALDVFMDETGELTARDPGRVCRFMHVAVGAMTGHDWRVQNIVGLACGDDVVALDCEVDAGQQIMFCKNDLALARTRFQRQLLTLAASLEGRVPRAGLYYSSLGAGVSGAVADELGMIEAVLGKFPLAGLFASREISGCRIDADTALLTVFA